MTTEVSSSSSSTRPVEPTRPSSPPKPIGSAPPPSTIVPAVWKEAFGTNSFASTIGENALMNHLQELQVKFTKAGAKPQKIIDILRKVQVKYRNYMIY